MRFRLGTGVTAGGGEGGGLAGGISRAISGFAMMPVMQAQAAEQGEQVAAKSALMASQQKLADAHAAAFNTQADGERQQQARGTTDALLNSAALQNGVPLHQLGEYATFAKTGQLPGQYVQPPEDLGGGPALPAPGYADPGLGRRIFQTLGLTQNALAQGDKSVENVAKAAGAYQKQDAVRASVENPAVAALYGRGFAASEGRPLVNNIGNTGRGFDLFTGEGTMLSPGLAALYDKGENAQIFQRNASGRASLASERHSDAGTRKINQEIQQGERGVIQQTPDGLVLVNPRTATSVPIIGPGGAPVQGNGGNAKLTEDQGKATGWLIQAQNAYNNMRAATDPSLGQGGSAGALTPGFGDAVARIPFMNGVGNWIRSDNRQKFLHGADAMKEAFLRAATGAGVNKEEALQKVQELIPQWGDGDVLIGQKMAAIPLYLEGLKVRAGPGAAKAAAIVAPAGAQAAKASVTNW